MGREREELPNLHEPQPRSSILEVLVARLPHMNDDLQAFVSVCNVTQVSQPVSDDRHIITAAHLLRHVREHLLEHINGVHRRILVVELLRDVQVL